MKSFIRPIAIAVAMLSVSCEGIIGEDGVVIDNQTGERVAGVNAKLKFRSTSENSISDENGYFNVTKMIGCGIGDCEDDYKITFTKVGYDTLTIDQSFYRSEEAQFVNQQEKDTLIIKLVPQI